MLRVVNDVYGYPVPEIRCEACGKPITTPYSGMVLLADPDNAAMPNRYCLCHKASECQDPMRRKAGHCYMSGPWEELPDFLVRLAASIGLFPDEFARRFQYCWEKDLVPEPVDCDEDLQDLD